MPRFVGPVDASISSGALRVQSDSRGGQAVVGPSSTDDNWANLPCRNMPQAGSMILDWRSARSNRTTRERAALFANRMNSVTNSPAATVAMWMGRVG